MNIKNCSRLKKSKLTYELKYTVSLQDTVIKLKKYKNEEKDRERIPRHNIFLIINHHSIKYII